MVRSVVVVDVVVVVIVVTTAVLDTGSDRCATGRLRTSVEDPGLGVRRTARALRRDITISSVVDGSGKRCVALRPKKERGLDKQ